MIYLVPDYLNNNKHWVIDPTFFTEKFFAEIFRAALFSAVVHAFKVRKGCILFTGVFQLYKCPPTGAS